jgi:hypothetical protein
VLARCAILSVSRGPIVLLVACENALSSMRNVLAVLQLASFLFSAGVSACAAAFLFGAVGDLPIGGPGTVLGFSITVAVVLPLATRSYHLWKWSLTGPRVGSLLLALGHIGLITGYLTIKSMVHAGAGSGLMLLPAFFWCAGCYPAGLLVIVISLLMQFRRTNPECRDYG